MSTLKDWIWLSTCINYRNITRMLERFPTPQDVMLADEKSLLNVITKTEIAKVKECDFTRAEEIIQDCYNKEITILAINDTGYPDILRSIINPPLVIYVKGRLPDMDVNVGINIIGTRSSTAYGHAVTKRLAYTLAKAGTIVVSGMAFGIDAIANKSAIVAGKPTVAVLGCSVDVCYPYQHRILMDDIIATGAVISEFPPTTEVKPQNFPQRNRIMSGLCRGTVIIEAPEKSGTNITANCALEQGRDLFAIPGNIDSPNSAGCNKWIKLGAKPTTCAMDILEEYDIHAPNNKVEVENKINVRVLTKDELKEYTKSSLERAKKTAKKTREDKADKKPKKHKPKRENMGENESEIYDIIASGTHTVDQVITESKLETKQVLSTITMLEIYGDVVRDDNKIKIKEI